MTQEPEFEAPSENGLIRSMRAKIRNLEIDLRAERREGDRLRAELEAHVAGVNPALPSADGGVPSIEDAEAYIAQVKRDQANAQLAGVAGLSAAVATSSSGFSTDLSERIAQTQSQAEIVELMRGAGLLSE